MVDLAFKPLKVYFFALDIKFLIDRYESDESHIKILRFFTKTKILVIPDRIFSNIKIEK
jgi:hypothetical protein